MSHNIFSGRKDNAYFSELLQNVATTQKTEVMSSLFWGELNKIKFGLSNSMLKKAHQTIRW